MSRQTENTATASPPARGRRPRPASALLADLARRAEDGDRAAAWLERLLRDGDRAGGQGGGGRGGAITGR